jgi:hypothetical protein
MGVMNSLTLNYYCFHFFRSLAFLTLLLLSLFESMYINEACLLRFHIFTGYKCGTNTNYLRKTGYVQRYEWLVVFVFPITP